MVLVTKLSVFKFIKNIICLLTICDVCMPLEIEDTTLSLNISIFQRILNFFRHDCEPPPNFPPSIELKQQTFHNWAEDIIVHNLWTAFPKSLNEIIELANWGATNNYTIKATAFMHTWSPLTVSNTSTFLETKILLVRTTNYLTKMEMIFNQNKISSVKVQTGTSMLNLMTFLEEEGYGFYATPAPGDISIGGVIAIGGHGTGVPTTTGEILQSGFTYGSLSNLIISFTAIVWDSTEEKYIAREFHRSEIDAKAFLTNLGRTFLYDVTLLVGNNYNLRCLSRVDIPASEIFAKPISAISNNTNSFENLLNMNGRVETLWFPFTKNPWLKVWTVSSERPSTSREVSSPFNYPFIDNIPIQTSHVLSQIVKGSWHLAPTLSALAYSLISTGLELTDSNDIWGPSKNLLLYLKPTTIRETANGYAVITMRSNVQNIIYSVVNFYEILLEEYKNRGIFPINGQLEIRVTGIDNIEDIDIIHGESPTLSAIRPVEGHSEFDTAVWFDILTFPGTPFSNTFLKEIENYLFVTVNDGINAIVRPEWSKGWGYTDSGPFTNATMLKKLIPNVFQKKKIIEAGNIFDKYDPLGIFSNDLLNQIFL